MHAWSHPCFLCLQNTCLESVKNQRHNSTGKRKAFEDICSVTNLWSFHESINILLSLLYNKTNQTESVYVRAHTHTHTQRHVKYTGKKKKRALKLSCLPISQIIWRTVTSHFLFFFHRNTTLWLIICHWLASTKKKKQSQNKTKGKFELLSFFQTFVSLMSVIQAMCTNTVLLEALVLTILPVGISWLLIK